MGLLLATSISGSSAIPVAPAPHAGRLELQEGGSRVTKRKCRRADILKCGGLPPLPRFNGLSDDRNLALAVYAARARASPCAPKGAGQSADRKFKGVAAPRFMASLTVGFCSSSLVGVRLPLRTRQARLPPGRDLRPDGLSYRSPTREMSMQQNEIVGAPTISPALPLFLFSSHFFFLSKKPFPVIAPLRRLW